MSWLEKIENISNKIKGKISFNQNLSKYSWFNLGGPAKIFYKPDSLNELSFFLKEIKGFEKIKVLGAGSNTLIRDGGFDGIIIRFGKSFSHISLFDETCLVSGAGALDKHVAQFALKNSLSGLEFLSCIPGTVGGAIRMNSGCYEEDVSKVLMSVQAIDFNGNIRVIPAEKIKFKYRGSNLDNNLIFLSATFKGNKNKIGEIEEKTKKFLLLKSKSQPSKIKTCGSTFKNPISNKAWQLIKNSGCEGMKVGDAQISEKHCNFFVNNGKARAKDLELLIEQVKKKVLQKTGVDLELELQIIGES